jgi:predicted Zn-dependent peptidase
VSLTQLELIADSVVERIKRDGPTADEVTRAKAGDELDFIAGLESNLSKAFTLASGEAFFGDPSRSFKVDYQKQQAVTAADIKRVANKYLTRGRIVLSVVPPGQTDKASKASQSTIVTGPKKGGI